MVVRSAICTTLALSLSEKYGTVSEMDNGHESWLVPGPDDCGTRLDMENGRLVGWSGRGVLSTRQCMGVPSRRLPLEGWSAMLSSDGIQRNQKRLPVAKERAQRCRTTLVRRGELDLPLVAARHKAMLSTRKSNLLLLLPALRRACLTARTSARPSVFVICSL